MIGKLRRVELTTVVLKGRVARGEHPENSHRHHEKREEREEPVVGDERRQVPRLVVAELLHDGEYECERRPLLLEPVDAPNGLVEQIRHSPTLTRPDVGTGLRGRHARVVCAQLVPDCKAMRLHDIRLIAALRAQVGFFAFLSSSGT
jgi:hypothetical protein